MRVVILIFSRGCEPGVPAFTVRNERGVGLQGNLIVKTRSRLYECTCGYKLEPSARWHDDTTKF